MKNVIFTPFMRSHQDSHSLVALSKSSSHLVTCYIPGNNIQIKPHVQ